MEKATNVTATEQWKGNLADLHENSEQETKLIHLEAPIFIIFAEYFGYVSKFLRIAEDWCDGKVPEPHIQKFLMIESASILRQMKKDYDVNDVHMYYERYYPLILEEYCDKLAKIIK